MRLLTILSSSRDTLLLPHLERRKVLPVARHFLVFVSPCYCSITTVPYVCLLYGSRLHSGRSESSLLMSISNRNWPQLRVFPSPLSGSGDGVQKHQGCHQVQDQHSSHNENHVITVILSHFGALRGSMSQGHSNYRSITEAPPMAATTRMRGGPLRRLDLAHPVGFVLAGVRDIGRTVGVDRQ